MRRSGTADLPLHGGRVPAWLANRMAALGGAIVEAMVWHYGRGEFIARLSDPWWFQAFGCVLGMDWHSSGVTTSVLGALKRSLNPLSRELGIYICGGRGGRARRTPDELNAAAEANGLDGASLVRASRLVARVDNNAVQDGFQIYLHVFALTADGEWAVIQQGMNPELGMARRYHWLSRGLRSFVEEPHAAVVGENQGLIINLTHREAEDARNILPQMCREPPRTILREAARIIMPSRHDVRAKDVDLARLGAVLATAHDYGANDFASLLLCPGLGPRTLRALVLISEVIHGTRSRFADPARFSFAHGGKDGHPFRVPLDVYDTSIRVLRDAVAKARLGRTDKLAAVRVLDRIARAAEAHCRFDVDFDGLTRAEKAASNTKSQSIPQAGERQLELRL